ncbi:MAG: substrate-binding domain-containing protein [Candidatus Sumerlaeia bacterium]
MSTKVTRILDCLAESNSPVSRARILEQTGLSSATLTRLLSDLTKSGHLNRSYRGYYELNHRSRKYMLQSSQENVAPKGNVHVLAEVFTHFERGLNSACQALSEHEVNCVAHPLGKPLAKLTREDLSRLDDAIGIIIFSVLPIPPQIRRYIAEKRIPVVKIGLSEHWEGDSVAWDQVDSYYRLTLNMIDNGYRSLIFYEIRDAISKLRFFRERLDGYERAMLERGLQPVVCLGSETAEGLVQLPELIQTLERTEKPVALVLARSDEFALRILKGLHREGYSKASNIAFCGVISHISSMVYEIFKPHLDICLYEPWEEMGQLGGEILLRRMQGSKAPVCSMLLKSDPQDVKEIDQIFSMSSPSIA